MDCVINWPSNSNEGEDMGNIGYEETEDDPKERELDPYQYGSMKAPVYNGL